MKSRKRINISVDEPTYAELQRIKEAYGFKSLCQFSVAMLNILCRYIRVGEERHRRHRPTVQTEIVDMFNDLGNWERTPDGIAPARHPRKKLD